MRDPEKNIQRHESPETAGDSDQEKQIPDHKTPIVFFIVRFKPIAELPQGIILESRKKQA